MLSARPPKLTPVGPIQPTQWIPRKLALSFLPLILPVLILGLLIPGVCGCHDPVFAEDATPSDVTVPSTSAEGGSPQASTPSDSSPEGPTPQDADSSALSPAPPLVRVTYTRLGSKRESVGEIQYELMDESQRTPLRFFDESLGRYFTLYLQKEEIISVIDIPLDDAETIRARWVEIKAQRDKKRSAERQQRKQQRQLDRARRRSVDLPSQPRNVPSAKIDLSELHIQAEEILAPLTAALASAVTESDKNISHLRTRIEEGESRRILRPILGKNEELHTTLEKMIDRIERRQRDAEKTRNDYNNGKLRERDARSKYERLLQKTAALEYSVAELQSELDEIIDRTEEAPVVLQEEVSAANVAQLSQPQSTPSRNSGNPPSRHTRRGERGSSEVTYVPQAVMNELLGRVDAVERDATATHETQPITDNDATAAADSLTSEEDSSDVKAQRAPEPPGVPMNMLLGGIAVGLLGMLAVAMRLSRPRLETGGDTNRDANSRASSGP